MKVRLVEWRRHELGDIELDVLPMSSFEYQGLMFAVVRQTWVGGQRPILELRRADAVDEESRRLLAADEERMEGGEADAEDE